VADIIVITVTPADAAGTSVPVVEVANQWAARLIQGLRVALPGRNVIERMYAPRPALPRPSAPRPAESQPFADVVWYWQGSWIGDGSQLVPDDPGRYSVLFSRDGRVAVRADCNRAAGTYERRGQALTVSVRAQTSAACRAGSYERRFLTQLNAVESVSWPGELLVLSLKNDTGAMRFSAVLAEARVSGVVTYRQRSALPTDAAIHVQLLDVSKADAPAVVVGQQTLMSQGRQPPFPFEIKYDPRRLAPTATLVLRVTITVGDRLLFATTSAQRVATAGYPSEGIEVVVQLVR
jgi:putative lipoprotein